jgi:hypothetical protein
MQCGRRDGAAFIGGDRRRNRLGGFRIDGIRNTFKLGEDKKD